MGHDHAKMAQASGIQARQQPVPNVCFQRPFYTTSMQSFMGQGGGYYKSGGTHKLSNANGPRRWISGGRPRKMSRGGLRFQGSNDPVRLQAENPVRSGIQGGYPARFTGSLNPSIMAQHDANVLCYRCQRFLDIMQTIAQIHVCIVWCPHLPGPGDIIIILDLCPSIHMDYNGYEYDYSCSGDEYVLALEMSKTLITLDSIHMDYNGYALEMSMTLITLDMTQWVIMIWVWLFTLDMSNNDMSMTLYSGYEDDSSKSFLFLLLAEYVPLWIEQLLWRGTPATDDDVLLYSWLAILQLNLDSLIQEFLDSERGWQDAVDSLSQHQHMTQHQRRILFRRPHLLASLNSTHTMLMSQCTHFGYTTLCYIYTTPSCFRHWESCILCLGTLFLNQPLISPYHQTKALDGWAQTKALDGWAHA